MREFKGKGQLPPRILASSYPDDLDAATGILGAILMVLNTILWGVVLWLMVT